MKTAAVLLVAPVLAACASDPKPTHERGWIGGRFVDVTRDEIPLRGGPAAGGGLGMPDSAEGDAGALLTAAYDGTPVAKAGLAPGDLVLAIDGSPVGDALDLRERVEAMAPGAHSRVTYWRGGTTRTADVVLGREVYEDMGVLTIGISLHPVLDLWPFDDGIDVLGLLRVTKDHGREDLDGPVAAYRREARPGEEVHGRIQETFDVFLLLVGVGKGKRVLRQETVP